MSLLDDLRNALSPSAANAGQLPMGTPVTPPPAQQQVSPNQGNPNAAQTSPPAPGAITTRGEPAASPASAPTPPGMGGTPNEPQQEAPPEPQPIVAGELWDTPRMSVSGKIIGAESGGDWNAVNKTGSTASGGGQFIESTWLSMMKQHFPDVAESMPREEQLQLRFQRDWAVTMTDLAVDGYRQGFASHGIEPTDGNLYAAHFFGPQAAIMAIKGPQDISAQKFFEGVYGRGHRMVDLVFQQNPNLDRNMTVAQLLSVPRNIMANRRAPSFSSDGSSTPVDPGRLTFGEALTPGEGDMDFLSADGVDYENLPFGAVAEGVDQAQAMRDRLDGASGDEIDPMVLAALQNDEDAPSVTPEAQEKTAAQQAISSPMASMMQPGQPPSPEMMVGAPPSIQGPEGLFPPRTTAGMPMLPKVDEGGQTPMAPKRPTEITADNLPRIAARQVLDIEEPDGTTAAAPSYAEVIDETMPVNPAGKPPSAIVNDFLSAAAPSLADSYGVPQAHAPRDINDVVSTANGAPSPNEGELSDEQRYRRRMMAADMLQAMSVGLGQMGAGQPVDLSGFFAQQSQRLQVERQEKAEREAMEMQKQEQARGAAMLREHGMNGLAAMAELGGQESYRMAMNKAASILADPVKRATADPRVMLPVLSDALNGNQEMAAQVMQTDPELARRLATDYLTDARDSGVNDGAVQGLMDTLGPMAQDTNNPLAPQAQAALSALSTGSATEDDIEYGREVLSAAGKSTEQGGGRSPETLTALADTMLEAGYPPTAIDMVRDGRASGTFIEEVEKSIQGRMVSMAGNVDDQAEQNQQYAAEAAAAEQFGLSPEVVDTIRQVGIEGYGSIQDDVLGQTNDTKNYARAVQDEEFKQFLIELRRANAGGTDSLTEFNKTMADSIITEVKTRNEELLAKEDFYYSTGELMERVLDPAITETGVLQGAILRPAQSVMDSLGIDVSLMDQEEMTVASLMDAFKGENFQAIRAEGSGQTSDMESRQFFSVFPTISDRKVAAVGLLQVLQRSEERKRLAAKYAEDYVRTTISDGSALSIAGKNEYIQEQLQANAPPTIPTLRVTDVASAKKQLEEMASKGWLHEGGTLMALSTGNGSTSYLIARKDSNGEYQFTEH